MAALTALFCLLVASTLQAAVLYRDISTSQRTTHATTPPLKRVTKCVETYFLCPHFTTSELCHKFFQQCPCTCQPFLERLKQTTALLTTQCVETYFLCPHFTTVAECSKYKDICPCTCGRIINNFTRAPSEESTTVAPVTVTTPLSTKSGIVSKSMMKRAVSSYPTSSPQYNKTTKTVESKHPLTTKPNRVSTPCVDTYFLCPHFTTVRSCINDKQILNLCPCTCGKLLDNSVATHSTTKSPINVTASDKTPKQEQETTNSRVTSPKVTPRSQTSPFSSTRSAPTKIMTTNTRTPTSIVGNIKNITTTAGTPTQTPSTTNSPINSPTKIAPSPTLTPIMKSVLSKITTPVTKPITTQKPTPTRLHVPTRQTSSAPLTTIPLASSTASVSTKLPLSTKITSTVKPTTYEGSAGTTKSSVFTVAQKTKPDEITATTSTLPNSSTTTYTTFTEANTASSTTSQKTSTLKMPTMEPTSGDASTTIITKSLETSTLKTYSFTTIKSIAKAGTTEETTTSSVPFTTVASKKETTTTTKTTTATTTEATTAAAATTTVPPTTTAASPKNWCYVCNPGEKCQQRACDNDKPYCMNSLTDKPGGGTLVTKTCVTLDGCVNKWFRNSYDKAECLDLGYGYPVSSINGQCHFCCVVPGCNADNIPQPDTWYNS